MERLKGSIFYGLCGLALGIFLDYLISTNVWLEMRVHMNWVINSCLVLGMVFGFFYRKIHIHAFFIIELAIIIIANILDKKELYLYYIKELLQLDGKLSLIKIEINSALVLINLIIIIAFVLKRLRKTEKKKINSI